MSDKNRENQNWRSSGRNKGTSPAQNWRQFGANGPSNQLSGQVVRRGSRTRFHASGWRGWGSHSGAVQRKGQTRENSEWLERLAALDSIGVMEKMLRQDSLCADRFVKLMKEEELSDERIFLLVKVLGKLCEIEFHAIVITLLQRVCCKEFIDKLMLFIVQFDAKTKFHDDVKSFFESLCSFFYGMLRLMPTLACERLSTLIKQTFLIVPTLPSDGKIIEQLTFINRKLTAEIDKRKAEPVKISSAEEALQYQTPPNCFRDIDILPSLAELSMSNRPFLRPNILQGPYQSVEHFLDVHFRLLKEDFVRPLREGIFEMEMQRNEKRKLKPNNIRVFPRVYFVNLHPDNDTIGLVLSFDRDRKIYDRIDWSNTKRFMTGSLLLLTTDYFASTLYLATVSKRDEKLLKKGMVTVEIQSGDFQSICSVSSFFMVESQAFFGAYAPVLEALKTFDEWSFPLKEYIVESKSGALLPNYLLDQETPQLKIKTLNGMRDVCVRGKMGNEWPTKAELDLDESQYSAFVKALTSRLILVQGPPGTGKTFLGLKVAATLLSEYNLPVWSTEDDPRPMLVVCYTNHALDQFLMGLLNLGIKSLVRVGGGCKEEKLMWYTLQNLPKPKSRHDWHGWLVPFHKGEVLHLKRSLECITQAVKQLEDCSGILHASVPVDFNLLSDDHKEGFADSNHVYISWLLGLEYGPTVRHPWPLDLVYQMGSHSLEPGEKYTRRFVTVDDINVPPPLLFKDMRNLVQQLRVELKGLDENITAATEEINAMPLQGGFAALYHVESEGSYFYELESYDMPVTCQDTKKVEDMKSLHDAVWSWSERASFLRHVINQLQQMIALQGRLKRCFQQETSLELVDKVKEIRSLWELNPEERVQLYCHWVREFVGVLSKRCNELHRRSVTAAKRLRESRMIEDRFLLENSQVIGMTTTYAAKNQQILKHLKPRIVLVEEAAEVLESHVVVSLAGGVEQLILIGDHQQLRPNPACYELGKRYHLDISLFERLINNKVDCVCLSTQHRMRPEIAALICPAIYPKLRNHEIVSSYPDIRGLEKNVFFVDHREPQELVEDAQSYRNTHEAKFVSLLVNHFLLQGYDPSKLTVLCTYTGQLFYFKKMSNTAKHSHLSEVRITVVDNFQGEENDIIILSLVRSNDDNEVGFLKIDNRVCVALSRAKHGLFIIGNMTALTAKGGIWTKIKEQLTKLSAIGESLNLKCEIHSTIAGVKCDDDFLRLSPNGGCRKTCDLLLTCGHLCTLTCHIKDREHTSLYRRRCEQPCQRPRCELNHPCPNLCKEECGRCMILKKVELPCGHSAEVPCYVDPAKYRCKVLVNRALTICGHEQEMCCWESRNLDEVPCQVKCDRRLDCGHACEQLCHLEDDPDHEMYLCRKPCGEKYPGCTTMGHTCEKECHEDCGQCPVMVSKTLECGHEQEVQCYLQPERKLCKKQCTQVNTCGHPCRKLCNVDCHPCTVKVSRKLPCSHEVQMDCGGDVKAVTCGGRCTRALPCGHPCTMACSAPCLDKCEVAVEYPRAPACGHTITVRCHEQHELDPSSPRLLDRCAAPCGARLQCGHECTGLCGGCWQGRLHVPCRVKCERTLICGHRCKSRCAAPCPPCGMSCDLRCPHGICDRGCGDPCYFCKKPCPRGCPHGACTNRCGEACSFTRCDEPCAKKVLAQCQHDCLGFCGEPCVCQCDVTDESFLLEKKGALDGTRFILLPDCGHVFEAEGLHQYLHRDAHLVKPMLCPRCSTRILRCMRYRDAIKRACGQIDSVKRTLLQTNASYTLLVREEVKKLDSLSHLTEDEKQFKGNLVTNLNMVLNKLVTKPRKGYNWKPQQRSSIEASLQVRLVLEVSKMFHAITEASRNCQNGVGSWSEAALGEIRNLVKRLLVAFKAAHAMTSLSSQETEDLNRELNRLNGLLSLCHLETSLQAGSRSPPAGSSLQDYTALRGALRPPGRSSNQDHHEVLQRVKALAAERGVTLPEPPPTPLGTPLAAPVGLDASSWQWCGETSGAHAHPVGTECVVCHPIDPATRRKL